MADAEAAQQDPIASANDRLRDAAKWLIAASAGVGAVLIADSQLSSIGKLDLCRPTSSVSCARLPVAALGAVVALAGVVIAIWAAVKILVPIVVPLRVLPTHWDDTNRKWADAEFFRANMEYLGNYDTPIAIERARKESYNQLEAAQQELAGAADDADRTTKQANVDVKKAKFEELQEAAGTVSSIAQHELLKAEFNKVLGRLLWAAIVTALGITAFAWAANPPTRSEPGAKLRNVDLHDLRLRDVDLNGADLTGANLTGADLKGATLEGAILRNVIWGKTTCPDGTISDSNGGTCAGHLKG